MQKKNLFQIFLVEKLFRDRIIGPENDAEISCIILNFMGGIDLNNCVDFHLQEASNKYNQRLIFTW